MDRNKVYKRNSSGRLVQEHGMSRGRRRYQTGGHVHTQRPYLHDHKTRMGHSHGPSGQTTWDTPVSGYPIDDIYSTQYGVTKPFKQHMHTAGIYGHDIHAPGTANVAQTVQGGIHGHSPVYQPQGGGPRRNIRTMKRGGRAGRRRMSRSRRRY